MGCSRTRAQTTPAARTSSGSGSTQSGAVMLWVLPLEGKEYKILKPGSIGTSRGRAPARARPCQTACPRHGGMGWAACTCARRPGNTGTRVHKPAGRACSRIPGVCSLLTSFILVSASRRLFSLDAAVLMLLTACGPPSSSRSKAAGQ